MKPTIVYLHGVGEGDPGGSWLAGLNRGLAARGADPIPESQTICPKYSWLLDSSGLKTKHPAITYKVKDDGSSHRAFVRRQARIERLLGQTGFAQGFGWKLIPDSVVQPLQKAGIASPKLSQVRNYMTDEGLRAAILQLVLDTLPKSGEIILIGHSLGSIIAIDLLDHLPELVHVTRFITIGSPGGSHVLHDKHERILKRFPYARVDDWTNFFAPLDPVTAGRGLASIFPGAQDFRIKVPLAADNPFAHQSQQYLAHPAVALLVADALDSPVDTPVAGTELAVRLEDSELDALIPLVYGNRIASKIKKRDIAKRYEEALQVLQDDFLDQARQRLPGGASLPPELESLAGGQIPAIPHRLSLREAVLRVVTMAYTDILHPFEIEVGEARTEAIPGVFADLGFTSGQGRKVRDAVAEVESVLSPNRAFHPGRIAAVAAGLALIAAGPIGIAAGGTAAGAAAITSGLAAFGPGGMTGGLALLGGLASTGAMVTTAAATLKTGTTTPIEDPTSLAIRVSASYALKLVDEQPDPGLWELLTEAEGAVSAQINKLSEFSDPKAPTIQRLTQARSAIDRLMRFTHDHGLGMQAIEA